MSSSNALTGSLVDPLPSMTRLLLPFVSGFSVFGLLRSCSIWTEGCALGFGLEDMSGGDLLPGRWWCGRATGAGMGAAGGGDVDAALPSFLKRFF